MTKLPIPECYWVEENRLLAGEYPGHHDPEIMRRRIDAFLEAGVDTFFDLTQAHELVPYEATLQEEARIYGIDASYQRFPIRDYGIPTANTMTAILNAIDEATSAGHCVYVHCWGGVGRTGLVVGCHLVRHGFTNQQAIAQVDTLFKTRPNRIFHPRSPESDEQVDFILNWWEDAIELHRNNKRFCEG